MKKIISFSLWGDNPKYCVGAIKNALIKDKYYPDWICRFYVHEDVSDFYINELKSINNTEVVISPHKSDWTFTTERFCAIDDYDVSHVIFRDTDSRLNQREADAVNEWIDNNKAIHIMKDHPYHGSFPILAGMWGINKSKFPYNMKLVLEDFSQRNVDTQYHYDQIFLASYIWPNFYQDATIHDEFFFKNSFPNPRKTNEFVGQVFDENDNTPIEHINALYGR
jgi:hypothetical protein